MAGVVSATLEGWAVPMAGMPWDHTYVTSSCGLRWWCWGRQSGGVRVSSGTGSSIVADCLSRQRSEAGIRYGITGVCHQTANRILYPARITVAGAAGYNLSTFFYNEYGLGLWPELSICLPAANLALPATAGDANAGGTGQPSGAVDENRPGFRKPGSGGVSSLTEFLAAASHSAEIQLDEPSALELASIQEDFRREQAQLVAAFDRGILSHEQYLKEFGSLAQRTMDRARRLLGEEKFLRIFGVAGLRPDSLIDPETFRQRTARRS
jgi:hypothetical protein